MDRLQAGRVKRVLVTGGTRGIGGAIAKYFTDSGMDVTITGTGPRAKNSNKCQYIQGDFTNRKSLETFLENISNLEFDILINNAGINRVADFSSIESSDFELLHKVNTLAPMRISQSILPYMLNSGWGRIINIASIWSVQTKVGRTSYAASKRALVGLSQSLAIEVAKLGVLVNCVSPGFVETELTKASLGRQGIEEVLKTVPMQRLGQPSEVAKLVGWLASEENTFMCAQNILIDGGFTSV